MKKKIGFIYIEKSYVVYHSLGIALKLAKSNQFDVHVLCTSRHKNLVENFIESNGNPPITIKVMKPFWYFELPHYFEIKGQLRPSLFLRYKNELESFDAFVCTMYKDLLLKKILKNKAAKYIFTNHGIPNRAYSFDERIKAFELIFLLGKNEFEIRNKLNHLTERNNCKTGFFKGELVQSVPVPKLFDNNNPTILYNPHWQGNMSSFVSFGKTVLDYFLKNKSYNLIFAPHSILLERNWIYAWTLRKYKKANNIIVDFGSEAANNMTYTRFADYFVGDVSSQAVEFVYWKKRPCLFLDAHHLINDEKERPLSWDLGTVISNPKDFESSLKEIALSFEKIYKAKQEHFIENTFYRFEESPSEKAANAIEDLLKN